jgi:hypothetical protein
MILNVIFCGYWAFTQWLQNHLLTCPFKALTGIDCPGCGFQRSVIALLQGDIHKSLYLYPATIPLFVINILTIADGRYRFDRKGYVKKSLYIFTAFIIASSYILKMSHHPFISPRF